jgi:peptidoglycan/xylan/chitin deacetylase (PgdA/CDA1 family)
LTACELREHFRTQKSFPKNSILITFDDGWKDNFINAMPALIANKIPALIFLSTGFINQQKRFWQERMTSLLLFAVEQAKSNSVIAEKLKSVFNTVEICALISSEGKDIRYNVGNFVQHVKDYDYPEISTIIFQLEELQKAFSSNDAAGCNERLGFLSWREIREMHRAGIDFGSHGVNHLILDKNGVDINSEIKQSKIDIETMLGVPVTAFSYPNGNYNQNIVEALRLHGYDLGFGTEFGYNYPKANPFTVKRINIHQDACSTIPLFIGRIIGLW